MSGEATDPDLVVNGRITSKTYMEAVQSFGSANTVVKETEEVSEEPDGSNWSWVMICERQVRQHSKPHLSVAVA